ncbi:methyltransferase family protein [Stutzerimonas nitrititolerans]|uniref:methyltransferase family protein n=1 Tax=Stutzerimonas nitrititolerans TaxID=2482751 RepID=UPI0028AC4D4C|nr:isoprenylcysteine carboxylmethyltransferase family protein [Stutzerimonas nitrititolerans]
MKKLLGRIDTLIYLIVGPFGVLYVFPRYLLQLEQQLGIELPRLAILKYAGVALMNLGGLLAVVCALMMYRHGKETVSPFVGPKTLLRSGPYAWVRHPMMWSGTFVLVGLMLVYSSPLMALWLAIWSRFAAVYIARYEEPYLESVFGEQYRDYCRHTPRWFPWGTAE